jgi:hypothetical protein
MVVQWWRQEIGVGVERCPVVPATHAFRQPRTRAEFAGRARANYAAHLHGQGLSLAAIGREFGVSAVRARQLVHRALDLGQ